MESSPLKAISMTSESRNELNLQVALEPRDWIDLFPDNPVPLDGLVLECGIHDEPALDQHLLILLVAPVIVRSFGLASSEQQPWWVRSHLQRGRGP